jgi:hypothetical protein
VGRPSPDAPLSIAAPGPDPDDSGLDGPGPAAVPRIPAPRAEDSAVPEARPARLAPERDGVLTMKEAAAAGFSRAEIRRRVDAGAWRLYAGDVLVTRPGPLTLIQRLWCALVSIGADAMLGGASAAALGGLRGCGEPWLTVILASGRRVTPRPGVKIRATARLGEDDLHRDAWPPRTALPRSLIDMAEWAASGDEARTVLALAVASGIVETDEIRAALARRGPIARRQLVGDALDDLDEGAPWVPDLLYRRVTARHGLPPATRGRAEPRAPGHLDLRYEPWRVRVEVGPVAAPGIRTAADLTTGDGPVAAGARGPFGVPVGWPVTRAGRARGDWLVLRVPLRLLREEPERVGAAVAATLRQRGWSAPRGVPGSWAAARVGPMDDAFDPALEQVLGPAVGTGFGGTGFGGTGFGGTGLGGTGLGRAGSSGTGFGGTRFGHPGLAGAAGVSWPGPEPEIGLDVD